MNSQADWLGFELSDAQLLALLKVCGIGALPGANLLIPDEQAIDCAWRALAEEGVIWNAADSLQAHYLLAGVLHTAAEAKRVFRLRAIGETFIVYENEGDWVCFLRKRGGFCLLIPVRTKKDAWNLTSGFAESIEGHAAVQINGKHVGRLGAAWKERLEWMWWSAFDAAPQSNE
ncbi:MAG: hypothetical protein Q4G52_04570 [Clostridia bacterium]|nr:hypothetical protein [Clostridia bacterium]